jgi:hypothetical protein
MHYCGAVHGHSQGTESNTVKTWGFSSTVCQALSRMCREVSGGFQPVVGTAARFRHICGASAEVSQTSGFFETWSNLRSFS